jgi:nucleotide-binding universal stress UspA family protein
LLPIHTILYPTDFSESAQQTFALACSLARDCGARVVVLYVMAPPMGHEELEARRDPEEYYGGMWKALRAMQAPRQDVHVEHRLEEGDAAKRIVEVAQEVRAGLIVMGTHGRTGLPRLLLGSVAEQALRRATCPILTVKMPFPRSGQASIGEMRQHEPRSESMWPIKTVLHPTDFSGCSKDAFRLACALTRDQGARLIVLHVTSLPDVTYKGYGVPGSPLPAEEYRRKVRQELERLQPPDQQLRFEARLEEGDPVTEILRVAAETGTDLIVMGTHGKTGLRHFLMGSVAEQVVRKAPCPVLTLKASVGATASQ